jgi:hypothetical protein
LSDIALRRLARGVRGARPAVEVHLATQHTILDQMRSAGRATTGFDYLRLGLATAVLTWHSIILSTGSTPLDQGVMERAALGANLEVVRDMTAGPPESGTIWSLQSLRFAAAMMVVYFHAAGASLIATRSYGLLPRNFQIVGRAGVDIFFVLSGVIIATTARRLTWREFAWRRFRRVVPMYLLISIPTALSWPRRASVGATPSRRCFFGLPPIE